MFHSMLPWGLTRQSPLKSNSRQRGWAGWLLAASASLWGWSILPSAAQAEPQVKGYYSFDDSILYKKEGAFQRFESSLYTSEVYKIFSEYPDLVWTASHDKSVEKESFYISGPRGKLFNATGVGEYWGYSNGDSKLEIFVLSERPIEIDIREILITEYRYSLFVIEYGDIRAYGCTLDISKFVRDGYLSINNKKYLADRRSNLNILAEIPGYLFKNGINLNRDVCNKSSYELTDTSLRINQDNKEDEMGE